MSQPVFFLLVGLVSVPIVTLSLCGLYALVVVGIRHYKRRHTGRVGEEDGDGDGDGHGDGNGEGRRGRGGSRGRGGGGPPPHLSGNMTAAWLEAQSQQAEFIEVDEYEQGAGGGGGRKQEHAIRTQTQGPPGPGPGPSKGAPPRNQRALAGATAATTPTARHRAECSAPPPVQWRSGAGVADSGVVSGDGASSVQGDEPPASMSLADRLHMRRALLQAAAPVQRATARAAAAPDPRRAHQSHEHEIEPSAEPPVSASVDGPWRPPSPLDGRQEMKQVPPRRWALPADNDNDNEVAAGAGAADGDGGVTAAPAADSGAQARSSTSADADRPKPKSRKKKSSREEKGQWPTAAGDRNEGHELPEEEPRAGRRSDASPAAAGARANQSNANSNGRARRDGADLEVGEQGPQIQTQTQPALQQLPQQLQMRPRADRYMRQQEEAGRLPPIAASSASGANANAAASVRPTGPLPGALWRASAEQTASAQGNGYDRKSAAVASTTTGRRAAMYDDELPAKGTSQRENEDEENDEEEEGEPSRARRNECARTQRNDRREHSLPDTMQAISGQWRQQRVVDDVRDEVRTSDHKAPGVGVGARHPGRQDADRRRDRRRSSSGSDALKREREARNSRSSRGPSSYPEEDEQWERQRDLESQRPRTPPRASTFAFARGQSAREREREPAAQASRQGRGRTPMHSTPPPSPPPPPLEAARSSSSRPFAQLSARQQNSRRF